MTMLVDDLARHPDIIDREMRKLDARRRSLTAAIESKLDRLERMADEKVEKMVAAGYRLDLVRLRREESAP
jgi:signal transduction histidine kinase